VLTWNAALIVEPDVEDTDMQYVLEFANAQLLELRYYDSVLDGELPRIYSGIAEARRGFHLLGRQYSRLLVLLHSRVTDATELVERVERDSRHGRRIPRARLRRSGLSQPRLAQRHRSQVRSCATPRCSTPSHRLGAPKSWSSSSWC
jgi:hypothetical protein